MIKKNSLFVCRSFALKFTTVLSTLLICYNIGTVHSQSLPQYTTNFSGLITNTIPFATAASSSNKRQWIYYPSNFPGAQPGMITKIYIKASATVNPSFNGFLIRMGTTTLSAFPSSTFVTNLDTVFYAATASFTAVTGNWIPITLQTPFFFDGTSNFVVEASHQGLITGFSVQQTTLVGRSIFGNSANPSGSLQDRLADFGIDITPLGVDAGLEGFVNLPDTVCEGPQFVAVTLKNHGPNPLNTVSILWKVDNVAQTTVNWSGSLAVNATANITLGSYHFAQGATYDITAYTHNPNMQPDTANLNDTVRMVGVAVKPSPGVTVNDTVIAICQGDTAWISGTLTGTAPWSFVIKEGTITHSITGITSSTFNIPMTPATSRTYTIEGISDGTGCEKAVGPSVAVSVQAAPPATITPTGPPAACMGDSVMLMGSVGLNFSYQWYHDGTLIPGATNYLLAAKAGGNYTVGVTSPIGCSNLSAPYTVYIHPLPVVFLGNDTVLLPHQAILLNAGAGFNSYLWSNGATSASLLVDTAGVGLGVQTIWVHVTDNHSCKGGDTILINFTPHPGIDGISNTAFVQVFPNPTKGKVMLHLNGFPTGKSTIELFGTDGRLVFRQEHTITGAEEQVTLDLQPLSPGVYFISAFSGMIHQKIKLVVQ